jgi:hypothetical protein
MRLYLLVLLPSAPTSLGSAWESASFILGTAGLKTGGTLVCQTTGGNGDADLSLRWNAEPSATNRDCYSSTAGSVERCSVEIPDSESILWVQVFAYSAVTDVVVECFAIELLPSIAWGRDGSSVVVIPHGFGFNIPCLLKISLPPFLVQH